MNTDSQTYISVIDASKLFKKSRRATHNTLSILFEDSDSDLPFAKTLIENGHKKHYYRLDKVKELVQKPRAIRYRRTCASCKKKFYQVNKETYCKACMEVDKERTLGSEYDHTALGALLIVLTSERAWRAATKCIVVFWFLAIALFITGCI